ncbi:MAG: hypothetical protein S4CHLAM45_12600 [Chlamydiales bacterium]|nr:hypothetical protein [Chlamydiales bacterium]MCH9619749.1 hypothetical protein [Chlamydiales bacterium]MCH9623355.1 hypothetical protein [Chlamydiales bacterium]
MDLEAVKTLVAQGETETIEFCCYVSVRGQSRPESLQEQVIKTLLQERMNSLSLRKEEVGCKSISSLTHHCREALLS